MAYFDGRLILGVRMDVTSIDVSEAIACLSGVCLSGVHSFYLYLNSPPSTPSASVTRSLVFHDASDCRRVFISNDLFLIPCYAAIVDQCEC